jgi:hypothetical protein
MAKEVALKAGLVAGAKAVAQATTRARRRNWKVFIFREYSIDLFRENANELDLQLEQITARGAARKTYRQQQRKKI